ncbi:MAG: hypothetical protein JSR37_07820 [Verrucomicrobia bacterium]|nr:hypothetical protein [Verrucomicrobiota bacterium]
MNHLLFTFIFFSAAGLYAAEVPYSTERRAKEPSGIEPKDLKIEPKDMKKTPHLL